MFSVAKRSRPDAINSRERASSFVSSSPSSLARAQEALARETARAARAVVSRTISVAAICFSIASGMNLPLWHPFRRRGTPIFILGQMLETGNAEIDGKPKPQFGGYRASDGR